MSLPNDTLHIYTNDAVSTVFLFASTPQMLIAPILPHTHTFAHEGLCMLIVAVKDIVSE